MSRDFTLARYEVLCETIRHLAIPVCTVQQFIEAGQPSRSVVILRHDVDRRPRRAIRMAEMEGKYGLRGTYYLRSTKAILREDIIRKLAAYGHEVGYHYETLAKARGDITRASVLFEEELEQFRRIFPVKTISMHGSPLSPRSNLELWRDTDYEQYGLVGEAYLTINYANIYYFTDTGRSWDATRYNLRDRVTSRRPPTTIHSTGDLIDFIHQPNECPVIISAHPNRWTESWRAWVLSAVEDWMLNQAKALIRKLPARASKLIDETG